MKKIYSYRIALIATALLCALDIGFTASLSHNEVALIQDTSVTEETLPELSYDDIIVTTTAPTTTQKHFTTTARITTQKHFTTTSVQTTTLPEETTVPETTAPETTTTTAATTVATTTAPVTTTTTAATTVAPVVRDYPAEVAAIVNAQRKQAGLPALRYDATLCKLAQTRADEISVTFSHTRPDGTSGLGIFASNGIKYKSAGENIAKGQKTPEQVMQSWNNSSGHYKNIMSSSYTAMGIGYDAESKCWVQLFMG